MHKSHSSFAAALLAAAIVTASGCNRSSANAKSTAAAAVPVQIAVAQQRDVPRTIESIGTVQALRTVAVKSQVDGMIAQIHFREGDEVKAGDLLVTLDRRPFENSLRIARADLENARAEAAQADADLERYRNLDQQDVISKEQFTQLQTKDVTAHALVQAKEAAVANAELQLGYTQIRAPIAGRTGQLALHEGSLVKANDVNQTIVTLNQLAPITVAFSVPESTLSAVRAAMASAQATTTVVDRDNGITRGEGKVVFVDNSVDATTGTITLKAEFPNEDHALWPGQFVRTQLQVGVDHDAIVVPSSAVQVGQNGAQVFVVKPDHTVELRPVHVSRTFGDSSLLADGVHGGETVVTDGQLRLVPGTAIEVKTLAAAANGEQTAQAAR